ncbi:MAG: ankyrin repeat domain-containing protein [Woeseiaceae bacterium]|nr:ankyrin repeat domain-containing protein [Woeseiaceae bacterium]
MKSKLAVLLAACAVMAGGLTTASPLAPIVDAAANGDAETLQQLLRSGADVNQVQGDGRTALHWAADRGNTAMARMLIRAGANLTAGTRIGAYTPLHIASRKGHAEIVDAMLSAGANPAVVTSRSGSQPLHLAAASPSAETVRLLLAAGADVDARETSWQQTPLIFAAGANRVENMRLLIDAGADVSVTTKVVDTAAREKADKAAEKRIVDTLAEFKARAGGDASWRPAPNEVQGAIEFSRDIQRNWPDVPDPACDPPQDSGEEDEDERPDYCFDDEDGVVTVAESREARAAKAKENPKPLTYGEMVGHWGGLTPLLHAVRQGYTEAALVLLDAGADINQPSAGDHTTPLLMAAVNGQFDLALVLLERGADPNIASTAGTTPLFATIERQWAAWAHYAHPVEYQWQQATHLDLMRALLDAGAEPDVRLDKNLWYSEYTTSVLVPAGLQYDGATPFWRAALALDVEAMKLLREYGADPMVPTRKIPERRRGMRDPMPEAEEEEDPTGLDPVPVGGPFVYPLHAAAGAGYGLYFMAHAHRHVPDNWLTAVRYLVEEVGYDVNMRDANGYTPLHHAAARGDNELISYLLEQGADVKAVSRSGQTTADMANGPTQRVTPFPETIDLLVSLGAVNNNNCVSC